MNHLTIYPGGRYSWRTNGVMMRGTCRAPSYESSRDLPERAPGGCSRWTSETAALRVRLGIDLDRLLRQLHARRQPRPRRRAIQWRQTPDRCVDFGAIVESAVVVGVCILVEVVGRELARGVIGTRAAPRATSS